MHAMILAAGRGERLRPLTDTTPKPLLPVHGKALIEYHLHALKKAGVLEVVINVHYRADDIMHFLGDGSKYGMNIHYSVEKICLGTGGGIEKALPLLGDAPFVLLSADIWTDYDFSTLQLPLDKMAHVVLVENPPYNAAGDFSFNAKTYTYGNIALLRPELFVSAPGGVWQLGPLLKAQFAAGNVGAQVYAGVWDNIGTEQQYYALCNLI